MSERSTGTRRMWPTARATMGSMTASRKGRLESEIAFSLGRHPDNSVSAALTQLTLFAEVFPASPTPWLVKGTIYLTPVTN